MYRNYILGAMLALFALPSLGQQRKFYFSQTKMGSPFNIIMIESDSVRAARLADQCFLLIDSFNHIFSDYDSTSELSRLSAHAGQGALKVSPALLDILLQSKKAYEKSKHTFDISIGPLSVLWRKSRKEKIFPEAEKVAKTKQLVGFDMIAIDTVANTVTLKQKGMRLDLGGIAKGYVAQQVIEYLHQQGIHAALADAGGDIVMSDAAPNTHGWLVGINIPETTDDLLNTKLSLHNIAVATSGDVYQYFEHDGKKYAHITDPRTGYGITFQRNVTVIAPDGTTADWLATACSILSIAGAKKIAAQQNAELFISTIKEGKMKVYQSKGFKDFWNQQH